MMEAHEDVWKSVKGSKAVPIIGPSLNIEPHPFEININKLIDDFKIGYANWKEIWKKIIAPDNWQVIEHMAKMEPENFMIKTEIWAKILYDLAAAFHHWQGNRELMVSLMTPLYFARVASFVNRTRDMDNVQAEEIVEEQAEVFENLKDYLIQRWDEDIDYYHQQE